MLKRASLRLVVMFAMLMSTVAPLFAAPRPAPIAPLTVVDATGRTVGRYVMISSQPPNLVYVTINNQLVVSVLGHRDNLFADGLDFSQQPLYYQTPNCTGTAYIDAVFVPSRAVRYAVLAKVGGLGGQVIAYVSLGTEWQPEQNVSFSSSRKWNGTNYQCFTEAAVLTAFPTSEIDVTGMFTEPFVIQ